MQTIEMKEKKNLLDDNELRNRVIDFISKRLGVSEDSISVNSQIERDLGCTGSDAADFIRMFARQFSVDLAGFHFDRHFDPEGISIIGCIIETLFSKRKKIPLKVADLLLAVRAGTFVHLGQSETLSP